MRRDRTLVLLAAAVAIALAGCGGGGSNVKSGDTGSSGSGVTGGSGGSEHRGGTMKLLKSGMGSSIDPQVDYDDNWNLLRMSNDGLLTYKQVSGEEGTSLVPDLAKEVPKPEDGGKTYTFTLRKGIKYSTGDEIKASDFPYTYEREFKIPGPGTNFFTGLIGGDVCLKTPKRCDLSKGVVADDAAGTVTFHLTKPDADFLQKMAIPFSYVVPKGTPNEDTGNTPVPATGPYMIKSYKPNSQVVWVRNPEFKQWSAEAQPDGYADRIEMAVGLTLADQTTQVANGQADWMYDAPPPDRLTDVATKYADRIHINPTPQMYYAAMDTKIPPFNDPKAREAINFAVDRKALVGLWGGPRLAQVTCQLLAPGFPGHEPYCPFTKDPGTKWTAPDMARAKQLVKESGTAGTHVTVITTPDSQTKDPSLYLVSLLKKLGYPASLKTLSSAVQYPYVQDERNKPQMSISYWQPDYTSPSNAIDVPFGCEGYHPNSTANPNLSFYCDKKIDALAQQARAKQVTDPQAANVLWAKVDKMTTDSAAQAPFYVVSKLDFVSRRLGNYQFNPAVTGKFMIAQAWVK